MKEYFVYEFYGMVETLTNYLVSVGPVGTIAYYQHMVIPFFTA